MTTGRTPAAQPPGVEGAVSTFYMAFGTSDLVLTDRGSLPAARLRPGDRISVPGQSVRQPVHWLALGNAASTGKRIVSVMLWEDLRPKEGDSRPADGYVSPQDGRLRYSVPGSSQRTVGQRLH